MIDFNFNIKENCPVYCVSCNKLLVNSKNPYLGKLYTIKNIFSLDSYKEVIEFIKKISNKPELFIFA